MAYDDYEDQDWFGFHQWAEDDVKRHAVRQPIGALSDGCDDYLEKMVFDMLDAAKNEVQRRSLLSMAVDRVLGPAPSQRQQYMEYDLMVNQRWVEYLERLRKEAEDGAKDQDDKA